LQEIEVMFYSLKHWRQRHFAALLMSLFAAPAVFAGTNEAAQTVTISNYAFAPNTLTIAAGSKVVWVNRDDDPHTVKSTTDDVLKSPALDTNDQFAFTFTKPGTYRYFCTLHPHMQGEIIVR
jgi:plastocyanin